MIHLVHLMKIPPENCSCPVCGNSVSVAASKWNVFGRWICHKCGAQLSTVHYEVARREPLSIFPAMLIAYPTLPLGGGQYAFLFVTLVAYLSISWLIGVYYKSQHDPKKWILIKKGTEQEKNEARIYYEEVAAGIRKQKDPLKMPAWLSNFFSAWFAGMAIVVLYYCVIQLYTGEARNCRISDSCVVSMKEDTGLFILDFLLKVSFVFVLGKLAKAFFRGPKSVRG